ncbi:MAG TPA: S26 family signal peptidase [Pirellulales bacterium]|nr:S26 family signal peptidase [Pirellulales bacterium]
MISFPHASTGPPASHEDDRVGLRFGPAVPAGSRGRSLRTLLEAAIIVLIAAALVRTWGVQTFTIDGSSMAPTLAASHVVIRCPTCGCEFTAGVDGPASEDRPAICPNCGDGQGRIVRSAALRGDTVLVDKSAFAWRRPGRWEVVAVRHPGQERWPCVKRAVGLPGEEITIVAGDVYVDGRIARKSLGEQRALAIMVHDDRFRPPAETMPPCWQAGVDSRWAMTDDGFSLAASVDGGSPRRHGDPEKSGENEKREDKEVSDSTFDIRPSSFPTDWLTYHHRRRNSAGVVASSPVDDSYAYNQMLPIRELHVVRDLVLSFSIAAGGTGVLYVRGSDGVHDFVCAIESDGAARLFCDGQPAADGQIGTPLGRATRRMEFSLVDAACRLAVDGREVLEYVFGPTPANGPTTAQPFAIAGRGMTLTISGLRIDRDAFYGLPASGRALERTRLGDGEYFLLSDNAPLGVDSRERAFGPAVDDKSFVGKPFVAVGASRPWPDWLPAIQVPALRQIRYIR